MVAFIFSCLSSSTATDDSRPIAGPSRIESIKLWDGTPKEQLVLHWSRAYKDLFSVNITGFGNMIFLTSFDVIKKLFVQNAEWCSNRSSNLWLINYIFKGKGERKNLIEKLTVHSCFSYFVTDSA